MVPLILRNPNPLPFLGGPIHKDNSTWGSILGSPCLRKSSHRFHVGSSLGPKYMRFRYLNPKTINLGIWLWLYYNKTPTYPTFYLLQGDYTP